MAKPATRRKTSGNPAPPKKGPAKPRAKSAGRRKTTSASKSRPRSSGRGVPVVGIGASAGGLDAFKKFFDAMPADSGAAFVLIQHLDPKHESLTAGLLAKHTAMPVVEARDGMRVAPNHVYTIPSNTKLAFGEGALRITKRGERRGVHAPVDFFFLSLAEQLREKAIGVILSGAGSDGTLGLKAIEGNDGMTLAQAPDTAQYDAMPKSAIATGCVDHVLPVEKMPRTLSKYLRHSYVDGGGQSPPSTAAGNGFKAILTLLRARTGHNLEHYKKSTLTRRIARRMGLVNIERHAEYLKFLREDPAEVSALDKDLFIGVTEFFRDPPAWEVLEQEVIKPLVARKDHREPIRVWCAGCATGEEAYSVAMLLLEQCERAQKSCRLQVFASDIDRAALEFARTGVYPGSIAAHVTPERLREFFTPLDDEHHYQVGKRLREAFVFAAQNLLSDPPFSKLDLILCRNLLIYIEPETQKRLIPLFHFALHEQGTLFLGSAETIGSFDDLFQPIAKKWRIFKRAGPARHQRQYYPALTGGDAPPAGEAAPAARADRGAALAQRRLLERFVPAAVLIDQEYNLLYFWGATDDYLIQPAGAPTQNLLVRLRQGLRGKLKRAVQEALRENQTVAVADIRVKRRKGFPTVTVSVSPIRESEQSRNLLVTFEDQMRTVASESREPDPEESLVHQLETELKVAKDDLQGNIEQSESVTEELKAANEEVTSINEELQSTNEELETSKEELQSVNEELATVNAQVQDKLEEVEKINTDLQNLLDSTDTATIFLDREFRITRFTPATTKLLPLVSTDLGRPISVFAQDFDVNLLRDAKTVLEKVAPIKTDVKTGEDRWYNRRVLPYHAADHRIAGVVVTFSDVTALKKEQQRAEHAREQLQRLNADLAQRAIQLRALASELTLAEERERQNLAADLHDSLGQDLTLATFKLAGLEASIKGKRIQQAVRSVTEVLSRANESVRSHIFELSPPVLRDLGLVRALEWLAEDLQKTTGLEVVIQHDGKTQPLDERIRFTLFRAARELLINVIKHAGVDRATVTLKNTKGHPRLTVEDQGKGFDPNRVAPGGESGFGLFSMRERFSYLGGDVTIESVPGKGSKITLLAPLTLTERGSSRVMPAP